MSTFIQKIKLVFIPFLLIAVAVVFGYTFLNWLLFIQFKVISINEDVLNIGLPIALSGIFVFTWLWPRIKLLKLKTKRDSLPFIYSLIASVAIIVPTAIAQSYVETASGKLTQLDVISNIDSQPATKYYSLKHFYTDKAAVSVEPVFGVGGRNSENFSMQLYFVVPILESADSSATTDNCVAWYGIKYSERISNRLSDAEKENEYQDFKKESEADFDKKDLTQFVYFNRIGNNEDHTGYNAAIRNNTTFLNNTTIVLVPVDEAFEIRNGNKLSWLFGSLGIGICVWFIMVAIPKLDNKAIKKFKSGVAEKEAKANNRELLNLFIPHKGFYIAPVILMANILVFIIMVFAGLGFLSFKGVELLHWGANYGPAVADGQWWRLVTSMFLHGGIMHLVMNMIGLFIASMFLEPALGKVKYAFVYLLTGILASAASLWWNMESISAGASGAVFGLYGVLLAFLLKKMGPGGIDKPILIGVIAFIGINLLVGFLGINIDNAAHVGGLVSGFIFGLLLSPQQKEKKKVKQKVQEQS